MTFEELLGEYEKLSAQNAQLQETVADCKQRLAEAGRLIAQLRRQVFGSKAERLTSAQQEQMQQLTLDLELQALRPGPVLEQILEEDKPSEERSRSRRRRARHPLPENIETETITLEPEISECPCCGRMPERINEEVSEVIDLIPARMIRRRTVRPKYACRCGGAGVAIAPLPGGHRSFA